MINDYDISALLDEWRERADSSDDDAYKIALNECIHDIEDIIRLNLIFMFD